MKKYKMIFSDIDGTLLDSTHQVRENTKKKIKEIEKKGIPFILVSARMPEGIYTIQKAADLESPIVAYSGGLVLDTDRKIIKSNGMSQKKADEITGYIKEKWNNMCISIYSGSLWISFNRSDCWIKQEEEITMLKCIEGNFIDILENNTDVHKIMCMGDPEKIAEIENILKIKYPELSVYRSKDTYLEIMDGKTLKSNAVKVLCEIKNISIEETISFGDNFNDIDMLTATGMGVAMGNAPDEVKKYADKITLDNDSEGLLHMLEKLGM